VRCPMAVTWPNPVALGSLRIGTGTTQIVVMISGEAAVAALGKGHERLRNLGWYTTATATGELTGPVLVGAGQVDVHAGGDKASLQFPRPRVTIRAGRAFDQVRTPRVPAPGGEVARVLDEDAREGEPDVAPIGGLQVAAEPGVRGLRDALVRGHGPTRTRMNPVVRLSVQTSFTLMMTPPSVRASLPMVVGSQSVTQSAPAPRPLTCPVCGIASHGLTMRTPQTVVTGAAYSLLTLSASAWTCVGTRAHETQGGHAGRASSPRAARAQ
jgi:hypothetical protein